MIEMGFKILNLHFSLWYQNSKCPKNQYFTIAILQRNWTTTNFGRFNYFQFRVQRCYVKYYLPLRKALKQIWYVTVTGCLSKFGTLLCALVSTETKILAFLTDLWSGAPERSGALKNWLERLLERRSKNCRSARWSGAPSNIPKLASFVEKISKYFLLIY